jgi:2'-5' RNA ligase
MAMMIRTFVEIAIPNRNLLKPLLDDLRRVPEVRVSPMSQLHITLAFVGDVDDKKVKKMTDRISSAVSGFGAFDITIGDTGRFPAKGKPNIVWVGAGPSDRLKVLADAVRKGLDDAGVDYDDKPFKAHITIGRCRGPTDVDGFIDGHHGMLTTFTCDSIRLMKSELSPEGAKHTVLATIPL